MGGSGLFSSLRFRCFLPLLDVIRRGVQQQQIDAQGAPRWIPVSPAQTLSG
jgi:hypothetical protein